MTKLQTGLASPAIHLFKDFSPLSVLYEGEGAPFPSRCSADWTIRRLRGELIRNKAIVRHCRRVLVHLERFQEVIEADAIRRYAARYECA